MKIKSAKSFRNWFKTKVNEIDDSDKTHNEDFVGTYYKQKGQKTINGFFKMYHGHTPDIAGYLPSILKIAEDGQAIYEFLQNAVDCGSTHFYIFYNEKYFLAINNGSPFDINGLESILNIAQTTKKDPDKIGRFGIGFKLAHRLVGKNEGTEELVQQYKGPILFSWSKLSDLESLLNNDPIENLMPNQENNEEFETSPYLLKILLTNFPSDPEEKVRDLNYNEKTLFPKEELNELVEFLNENFQLHADSLNKNVLQQGSMFFIKLGEDKKRLLDKDYSELVDGIQYSMNTLKNLEKVYINSEDIEKTYLQLEEGLISRDSDEFKIISPEYKEFDIKFAIGFPILNFGNPQSYEQIKLLREKPNFYKYFPMGDEVNGLGFIVHCDSFSNEANRRKLHEDEINRNLFPEISKFICQKLTYYQQNDRSKYLNLYASILLSDIPERQNNKWLKPIFYDYLLNYLKENIPTTANFSNEAKKVKINKLNLQLKLSDFGLDDIVWFQWSSKDDQLLIEEALKPEKLGLKIWDIKDIIENADLDRINTWIKNTNDETYNSFLREIASPSLRNNTRVKLSKVKLFKFSDGNFYSLFDITGYDIRRFDGNTGNYLFSKRAEKMKYYFFHSGKTKNINDELNKLGFESCDLEISKYVKVIFSDNWNVYYYEKIFQEKLLFDEIAEKCKTNKLLPQEKKKLFFNLVNESTKFNNVSDSNFMELSLFSNSTSEILPLKKLIAYNFAVPSWLNSYKIEEDEYFPQLHPYLISDRESLFNQIYLPAQDKVLPNLTDEREVKQLINLFEENKKKFFNEFIIKRNGNEFAIIAKTNGIYQVQSNNEETNTFINQNLPDKLFVLPPEFFHYKENEGIVKGDDLYNLILEVADINLYKESLVKILKYNSKFKFLQKIPEIRLNPKVPINIDDYEFKVIDLACKELNEEHFKTFRQKLILVTNNQEFKLLDLSHYSDEIEFASKKFTLSKIFRSNQENSYLISDLVSSLSEQGIPKEKLNALFGVNEEQKIDAVFKKFSELQNTLEEPEQLFFLLHYHKHIENVDLSHIGFDHKYAVYPSEFALEAEKLPDYIQNWIKDDKIKIADLKNIGVFTENSTLVSLRKFFLNKCVFDRNTIAKDPKLEDGQMLFNTFKLLIAKQIEINNEQEFSVFQEMVRVINTNQNRNVALKIREDYNFKVLEIESSVWKSINNFTIHTFQGELPKLVKLNEIDDYIFYKYNDGDYAVKENKIFINENVDKKNILQKVAVDENNNFTFEALWSLFSESSSREIELQETIAKLTQQVAEASNATLATETNTDLSRNDQQEVNREAKEIVKKKLQSEGFEFTNGIGEFSTIDGVIKDGELFPLVVKSYINQNEPLKIGVNEWIHLMKPNSMFWVYFGNDKTGCLKLNELLKNQDNLTIRFSTENLDIVDRLDKFSDLLNYFGNVNFNFDSLRPSDYSLADDLNNYKFDERQKEEDLSYDDESYL